MQKNEKIFLDTDVLLDLLLDRTPFADDIALLIEKSVSSEVELCVSPISITNTDYVIGRLKSTKKAASLIKKILKIVHVENVGQSTIDKAINSKFKDFEDGVQNFCAQESAHEIIITRNVKDYKESELSILTPREYLAKIEIE